MGASLQTDQEKLIESLRALVTDEQLRAGQRRFCLRRGAVMQYRDATFWLYGTDPQWREPRLFSPREVTNKYLPAQPRESVV
jgi:hypothetical protein